MIEQVLLSKIYAANLEISLQVLHCDLNCWRMSQRQIAPHGQRSKSIKKVASIHTNCKAVASNNNKIKKNTTDIRTFKMEKYCLYLSNNKSISWAEFGHFKGCVWGPALAPGHYRHWPGQWSEQRGEFGWGPGIVVSLTCAVCSGPLQTTHSRSTGETNAQRDKCDAVHRGFTLRLRAADVTRHSSFYF